MKRILVPLAVAGIVLSGTAAMAQSVALNSGFDALDTDRSGGISWAELSITNTDVTEEQFNLADANGDGVLDPLEYEAISLSTGSISPIPSRGGDVPPAAQSLTVETDDD